MIPKLSGIYCITNTVNGKIYIGQAIDLNKRKNKHFCLLSKNTHVNRHLQSAYNKYGKDNFIFKVILYCEPFELTRYEQGIVDIASNVYNIRTLCVDSNKGITLSEETRNKLRLANIGKVMSEETKLKISKSSKGRIISAETRTKMTGKKRSTETRSKISEALKGDKNPMFGRVITEDERKALSVSVMGANNGNYGKHMSEDNKLKLSIRQSGSNNSRFGIKHTEESKAKMSKSIKLFYANKKRQEELE